MREDMQVVGVAERNVHGRAKWRQMIYCGDSKKQEGAQEEAMLLA